MGVVKLGLTGSTLIITERVSWAGHLRVRMMCGPYSICDVISPAAAQQLGRMLIEDGVPGEPDDQDDDDGEP